MVDGNNLRGIGKFEWDPIELHHYVVHFCMEYNISRVLICWDHGHTPFACSQRYESLSQKNNTVDMLMLFSGLSRRADDILVSESKYLVSSFCHHHGDSDDSDDSSFVVDWPSIAFVTSDRELNYKLRTQVASESFRSALQNENIYNKTDRVESLICDSKRFLELLKNVRKDSSHSFDESLVDQDARKVLQETKASFKYFATLQRRSYNSRREKTWERCVQAETFRRTLCRSFSSNTTFDNNNQEQERATYIPNLFMTKYLEDLYAKREYTSPADAIEVDGASFIPFRGPARLDKKQRKLLERYNRLAKKNELQPNDEYERIQ